MHARAALAVLVVMSCTNHPAAQAPSGPRAPAPGELAREDPDWLVPIAAKRIVYSIPGMEQLTAKADVVYKRAGNEVLTLDVWSPKLAGPRPAIVFVHGGPIPGNLRTQPKDWGVYQSYGQLAAASGYVGITFNHRLYGLDRVADSLADLVDLVAHVHANAASYGVDRERICLWAFSGGGPLLGAAFNDQLAGVRCMVSFYGLLDRRQERAETPASISDAMLRELSPVYRIAAGQRMPPMLIARAGNDAPVINVTVDEFVREAKAHDAPVRVIEHPTGHHSFDILDDDDRSREIIAEALRFVAAHLTTP